MPTSRALVLSALCLALAGCPPPVTECDPLLDDCTDGGLQPDWCDSRQQADEDAVHCHLPLGKNPDGGTYLSAYISTLGDGGVDRDWYRIDLPAGLTGRSLLHVNAGYAVPQTGVNFDVNVLQDLDGGLTSLVTGTDVHGGAAPKPVDLVLPFSRSSATLYLLVGDKHSGLTTYVDNRNRYSVMAEVMDNPDPNEPNDVTPTVVPLAAANGGLEGTTFGYLATDDDVDRYSFDLTVGGRQIIYLHLTGSSPAVSNPPANFGRLGYALLDPDGNQISQGTVVTAFDVIDLATARLAPKTGKYTVVVRGFQPANSTGVVKGDLRVRYDVDIRILPEIDTALTEPNDSYATANSVAFAAPGTRQITGRLSYVTDNEWFKVTLPARSGPSTFRYQVTPGSGGGRFAPTAAVPARELLLLQPVAVSGNPSDNRVACHTNPAVCPRSFNPSSANGKLGYDVCEGATDAGAGDYPPSCLFAKRDETARFTNLKNLVGAVPVESSVATTFYLWYRALGQGDFRYADDKDWTLTLEWADDPDRAGRLAGPTVLSGASTTTSGQITFGYGLQLQDDDFDLSSGAGIRGPNDYDAVESDRDLYQVNLGTGDQSWDVSWDLQKGDAGSPPAELGLELTFCSGAGPSTDGGLCAGQRTLGFFSYTDRALSPWWQPNNSSTAVPLFTQVNGPGSVTITALPVGCECVSARHTAGGRFFVNVAALHRLSNAPLSYTLRQTVAPYPAHAVCPVVDAGCGFDNVP